MTTDEIISRCYEHGQPDYILAADRLKELQAQILRLNREGRPNTTRKHAERSVKALRDPAAALMQVPNTIRQSIANALEDQIKQADGYGLALFMIRECAGDPADIAKKALAKFALSTTQEPKP
jgi:hypothetical protein